MPKTVTTQKTTQPSDPLIFDVIPLSLVTNPQFGIVAFLVVSILLLKIFKPVKARVLDDGRWATAKEIDRANKRCQRKAAKLDLTNPILSISEPVGKHYYKLKDWAKADRMTCFSNAGQAIAIIGASGYGKTKTILDPLVKSGIERGDSIMLVDPKFPEQASQIISYAKKNGYQIKVFAPGESFPESDSFNIFDLFVGVRNPALEAVAACATIMGNANAADGKPATGGDPFFDRNAPQIAACSMLLANWISRELKDPNLNTLPFAYSIMSSSNFAKRLTDNLGVLPFDAQVLASSVLKAAGSEKTIGSLLATTGLIFSGLVMTALYSSCGVAGNFPGFSHKEPLKLTGKQLLVFGLDQDLPTVVSPIICAAVEIIARYNLNSSRPRSNNLLLCMDEFAALYLPAIKQMLAEKRSMGLITLLALQTPSQFVEKYGQGADKSFMDRVSSTIFMNPNSQAAAKEISELLGNKEVSNYNTNSSSSTSRGGGSSGSGLSENRQTVAIMTPAQILQMPAGKVIIRNAAVTTLKGVLESKSQYFQNQKEKLPYMKRFEVDHIAIKKEEVFARKEYTKMAAKAAAANAHKLLSDEQLRETFAYHREVIDRYLPLAQASPPPAEKAKTTQRVVMLEQVIAKIRDNGYFVAEGFPDKKIIVPEHFSDNLTVTECQQLLEREKIKYVQFANH